MITAIKDSNVEAYKNLFEEASDILSGYERVQTFDTNKKYYYKDTLTKEFIEYIFTSVDDNDKLYEFANALVEHDGIMYTPILNEDGTEKGPVENFSSKLGITSLEEYFNWLPDLKRGTDNKPTKYTILPLDEPHFEINANTRAINIPSEFKKNGIAVQGDDLAEVVYFKVDRYFDAMDLNNTIIYIEWETPKDKTHDSVKNISDVYIRDIVSEPGKLIFGWAISDALTAAAGNLKFSVKFLQWDENAETGKKSLAYALNTLTATIAIQQGIGIDIENDYYEPDNVNDRLLERIEPGVVVGGLQAETPYFLENLDANIEYDIEPNHTDGTLKISAIATASDTGAISYVWKRKDLDANNVADASEIEIPNSSKTTMVEVPLGADGYPILVERHKYCYGSNYTPFVGTIEDVKTTWMTADQVPTFYEEKSVLEVEKYGVYFVEARNRIFNSMSKKKSNTAIFKRPDTIEILVNESDENQKANGHILGSTSAKLTPIVIEKVGDMTYQWYKAPEIATAKENHTVIGLPANAKISYGEDTVKVAFAKNTKWEVNDPENNPDAYMYNIRHYAPTNAVKYTWTAVRGSYVNGIVPNTDKWDIDPVINPNHVAVDEKGKYVLSDITAALKSNNVWISLDEYQSDLTYGSKGNTIVLEWYDINDNLLLTDTLNVEVTSEELYTPVNNYEELIGSTDKEFEPVEEGLYMAHITRTRNRGITEADTIEYRVTEAPAMPKFTEDIYTGSTIIDMDELKIGERIPYVEMTEDVKYDEYEVKWYLFREGKDDLLLSTSYISNRISKFNPIEYASILTENNEDVEGRYYALVRNKRNGVFSESTAIPDEEAMFVIVD